MKKIELTENKVALIDDIYFEHIIKYKWSAVCRSGRWYAFSFVDNKICSLHRLIMTIKLERPLTNIEIIDHINGNSLDNRCDNLRICDRTNNGMNRGKNKNNTTGFKGVMYNKNIKFGKRFYIKHYYKKENIIYAAYFYTAQAAALFYDDVVNKLYEIVGVNFPQINEKERSIILKMEMIEEKLSHEKRGVKKWSKYKGVTWHGDGIHWRSRIRKNNEVVFDKLFKNEIEAAKARDDALNKLGLINKSYTNLNFK